MKRRDLIARVMAEGAGQSIKKAKKYLLLLESKHPGLKERLDGEAGAEEVENLMRSLREEKAGVRAWFGEGTVRYLTKMRGQTPGGQN